MRLTALLLSAALGGACSGAAEPEPAGPSLEACAAAGTCGGRAFVAESITFAEKASDGTLDGFDLDDLVSEGEGPVDCYKEDYVSSDGDAGVDNQLGAILESLPTNVREQLPATIQASVYEGSLLFLIEFTNGASLEGDGGTGVVFRYGAGMPLRGTDGKLLPHQTIALDPDPLLGFAGGAAPTGRGVEGGLDDLRFRMKFIATPLAFSFHRVKFRFKLEADGTLTGIAGGTVTLDDVMGLLGNLGGDDTALRETLEGIFPGLADVYNPATRRCDAISGALRFTAVPAFIYAGAATAPAP